MAGGGLRLDSAGVWLKRARGGVEKVDGKAAQLWARRIEAGRTGMAGVANGGSPARALRDVSARKEKKGREGVRSFRCSREDKGSAQTPRSGRDRRRVASLAGGQRRYGRRGRHSAEQEFLCSLV